MCCLYTYTDTYTHMHSCSAKPLCVIFMLSAFSESTAIKKRKTEKKPLQYKKYRWKFLVTRLNSSGLPSTTTSAAVWLFLPLKILNDSPDYISFSLNTVMFVKTENNSRSCKTPEKKITLNWNIIQISPWETINLLFHLTNVTSFLVSLA